MDSGLRKRQRTDPRLCAANVTGLKMTFIAVYHWDLEVVITVTALTDRKRSD